MNPPHSAPAPGFQDRSTGLTLFGLATILLGGLCACFVPMMFFGQTMTARTSGMPVNFRAVVPGAVIYGLMAIVMVWLGIGSLLARRWARTLLLIFAGSWLIMGVLSLAMMAMMLPQMMEAIRLAQPPGQAPLPEVMLTIIMGIMLLVMAVIFLVLPGVWTLFYRSPHVKATCEARDPVERWTDRCPGPVLSISLWLALGVPMMLSVPLAYHGVIPFFGVFLTGVPGTLIYLLLAVIWTYAAWATYRLDPKGWWVTLISFTLFGISAVVTYARHDPMEMYSLMGFPEQQLEQMRQFGVMSQRTLIIWSVLFEGLLVGSLLYVRKHFQRAEPKFR